MASVAAESRPQTVSFSDLTERLPNDQEGEKPPEEQDIVIIPNDVDFDADEGEAEEQEVRMATICYLFVIPVPHVLFSVCYVEADRTGTAQLLSTPTPSMACNSKQIGWWHVTFAIKISPFLYVLQNNSN